MISLLIFNFFLIDYIVEKLNPDTGKWIPVGKAFKPELDVTGLEPGKGID